MQLHLVGGFLGSGKTTAIIGAAKYLMAQGRRVGVITNDQGKYLVDTAFFELAHIPTVEVTGGCFCCNYDDLDARLTHLQASARPEVIFAESVGSCADVVATVLKPLLALKSGDVTPSSLTVFADSRLLRLWLLGQPLPFADNVVYIFEKQLEEAGVLIINKIDLLTPAQAEETGVMARQKFPDKIIRQQNSLVMENSRGWLELLTGPVPSLPGQPLEIDYARYGDGEAQLAWLDEEIVLTTAAGQGKLAVEGVVKAIVDELRRQQAPIGHLKFMVRDEAMQAKISFPTLTPDPAWPNQIPAFIGGKISVLINARVQMEAAALHRLVAQAVDCAAEGTTQVHHSTADFFHPGFPQPTHRMR
jgi:Ni2+-binding GTPase involved in maturation of urease and hydrogenase